MSKPVAIVTGVGGDIGKAIAAKIIADGYLVVGADIDLKAAQVACNELDPAGKLALPVICDVTDETSTQKMTEFARKAGDIHLLVNNAGAVTAASLHSMSVPDWKQDTDLNLNGAFVCFQAVAQDLKANKGCVVNIASVNGLGVYGHPAYSSAKAGLIHFTKMIAVEYGKFGVRANAVAPGTVRTQAWEERAKIDPEILDHAKRWCPLQRIAQTTDIANVVAFLASPLANAITGVCLPVDCGLTAGQTELAATFCQSTDY